MTPRWRPGRPLLGGLGLLALLCIGFAWGERAGWPWLAQPLARVLSDRLGRTVQFGADGSDRLQLHLLGGVRLQADRLQVAPPAWAASRPPTLDAQTVQLDLRYRDLLTGWRGGALVVQRLQADRLALDLLRDQDGRATWQTGQGAPDTDVPPPPVQVRTLAVQNGTAQLQDDARQLTLALDFSLAQGAAGPGIQASATGRLRQEAITAALRTEGPLPWVSGPDAVETGLTFHVQVGQAALAFDGRAGSLSTLEGLRGTFGVGGLSLAPVGRALDLTLPASHPFAAAGSVAHHANRWDLDIVLATVGRSSVHGQVHHDTVGGRGRVTGSLVSPLFQLRDLAPAIGAAPAGTPAPAGRRHRTLPDRPFDLAALRAMDADVQLSVARLDLGTPALQAVQALDTRLRLDAGVLVLDALTARLADGRVTGRLQLDGRQTPARWDTTLRVHGLRLEHWVRAVNRPGQPPYASGQLGMTLQVAGRGRSTAELLATANGRAVLLWTRGAISHLLVEAAGLDLAQGLGVLLVGDDVLPVTCGAADLRIHDGQLTPTLLMVDTRDSTLWVEGQASFASETLALTARVHPKDFSPLSLRSPLRVEGTFAAPRVQLERGALLGRLGPAALLALVTPLAGLLPLLDTGGDSGAPAVAGCTRLMRGQVGPVALGATRQR